MALVLQETEGTLRVRAHRGLLRLRAILSGQGHSLAPAAVAGLLGAGMGIHASAQLTALLQGLAASGGLSGAGVTAVAVSSRMK